jgi:signal transduction histidine kinase
MGMIDLPRLNIYTFPVLIALLLNGALILLVLAKTSRNRLHLTFVAWTATVAIWNMGALGIFGATNETSALFWSRVCYCGNTLFSAFFLHMVLELCEMHSKFQRRLLGVTYAVGVSLLLGNFLSSRFLAAGVVLRFWGYAPVGGPGTYVLDVLLLGTFTYCLWLVRQAYHRAWDVRRNQLQYVFWGILIFFAGGVINVLMVHGVDIYPFGNLLNIVFCLSVAYAILSYQWLDIRLALRQSLVYGSLGTGLTLTYVGVVYFIEKSIFANHMDPEWVPRLLAVPPTIILAPTLKSKIQPWVEQRFFANWETPKKALRELGCALCTCLDIPKIAELSTQGAMHALTIQGSALLLRDGGRSLLYWQAAAGSFSELDKTSSPDPHWFENSYETVVVTRELDWRLRTNSARSPDLDSLHHWLVQHRTAVALPVRFQSRLLGIWLLANRVSRDMLPQEHLDLLKSVASQMALALNNAMTVQQLDEHRNMLQKTRELAVIGTLATEIAHEISKPLTRIMNEQTRMAQAIQGKPSESLKKILKEAQRASEILDGFAMLSPERTLHCIAVSLADLMEEALANLGVQTVQELHIIRHYAALPSIWVNPGQTVQILTNLIQNAWEAMPEGGDLTLSIQQVDINKKGSWVEVSISDTGGGIPLPIQEKIFDPFFTTKQTQGGRGMGLTISRAMVERHAGTILIQSPIAASRGTRVIVRWPMRPPEGTDES